VFFYEAGGVAALKYGGGENEKHQKKGAARSGAPPLDKEKSRIFRDNGPVPAADLLLSQGGAVPEDVQPAAMRSNLRRR